MCDIGGSKINTYKNALHVADPRCNYLRKPVGEYSCSRAWSTAAAL